MRGRVEHVTYMMNPRECLTDMMNGRTTRGACLRYKMNRSRQVRWPRLRYMMNRNRQMRGRV